MDTTNMQTMEQLDRLEHEMHRTGAALMAKVAKTVRKGGVPADFAEEKKVATVAYRAYWDAYDLWRAPVTAMK